MQNNIFYKIHPSKSELLAVMMLWQRITLHNWLHIILTEIILKIHLDWIYSLQNFGLHIPYRASLGIYVILDIREVMHEYK